MYVLDHCDSSVNTCYLRFTKSTILSLKVQSYILKTPAYFIKHNGKSKSRNVNVIIDKCL